MNASATATVRFFCLGLLGMGLAACAGESASSNSAGDLYGVVWTGDIPSTTGDTLMVEACWNDSCLSQVVPVAGLAPESSWDQYRPADSTRWFQRNASADFNAVDSAEGGECRTFKEWDDDMGISSCAATGGASASKEHLEVFLDLSVMKSRLRMGDEASLRVTNEGSDASLVERTIPIDAAAPYYAVFNIEE